MTFLPRIIAALALCLALPALAETPTPATTPEVHPALWRVSDADTTIYLFGTIHVLPDGVEWMKGQVATAFAGSQELVTELSDADPARTQAIVMDKAVLPKGKTLRQLMSKKQRKAYEAALVKLGLPAQVFDGFEPWYAALGLSTLPMLGDGYSPANGVDSALEAQAKERSLARTGLETAEYQLGLFDGLPPKVQQRYLREVIDSLPTMRDDLRKMIEAWRTGDAEGLAALMNAAEDDPVLLERLLISRNRAWADWIRLRLDQPGTVFFAVGAGHLAGKGSVQQQLFTRGIIVRRVQ